MKQVKYENVSKLLYVINNNFNKIDKLCKLGFPPFLPSSTNLISVQVICDIISDPFFSILFSF